MSRHYETPKRDCRKCTGNTFPNGCAGFCDNFEETDDELYDHSPQPSLDDDFDLDPRESRGEYICDNCLVDSYHCPGQSGCTKYQRWLDRTG